MTPLINQEWAKASHGIEFGSLNPVNISPAQRGERVPDPEKSGNKCMTDEQVQSMLRAVRSAAETLHGDGYHHPNAVPTQAAYDIRFLLAHFDRPQLDPNGCAALVGNWIRAGTYRSVIHRHDGTFVAADESERKMVKADTLPLLSDALLGWPQHAEPLPPSVFVKVELPPAEQKAGQ